MNIVERHITSIHNQNIKLLLELQQKSSLRRKTGLFVVEGLREFQHCIDSGHSIEKIFCCEGFENTANQHDFTDEKLYTVSPNVYEKIAYRGSTEGIVAIVHSKNRNLNDLVVPQNALILVLEKIEKPGNIGAILRSADAANVSAVILCDTPTDTYNPNIIRSSLGALFTVPVVSCSSKECIDYLKQKNVRILTAQLQDSALYYDVDMTCSTAIVMGTEATGLTNIWRETADLHILIPMLGNVDSLNVSVSAAILMYEAIRQRLTKQ